MLREVAKERFDGSYVRAMRDLSHRLASVELVRQLVSTRRARQFVERLLPAVKRGEKTLIVTRKAKEWGIKAGRNVVVYTGGTHPRGASRACNSRRTGHPQAIRHQSADLSV